MNVALPTDLDHRGIPWFHVGNVRNRSRIMKLFACLIMVASCFQPLLMHAAEVANARIWCLSIRFQQGMDSFGDTLDLSTISSTANGELAPYNGLTYASGFSLDVSGLPIAGTLYLNLPAVAD